MNSFSRFRLLIKLCFFIYILHAPVCMAEELVTLFVPVFSGPRSLGKNVTTILSLQIWQTLMKAPWPNPKELSFGQGLVVWGTSPFEELSHKYATEYCKNMYEKPQIVLWGKVREYGRGAIVQAFLTIPNDLKNMREHHEIWGITFRLPKGNQKFRVNLPQRRYEFEPVILNKSIIEQYSDPSAIVLFSSKDKTNILGQLGDSFRAIQPDGLWVKVRSNKLGKTGWIALPQLANNRNEIVNFVGGLIRIMRADWGGAIRLLRRVNENSRAPTSIQIDALLLRALAKEKQGQFGWQEVSEAYRLNPLAHRTIQYMLMCQFAQLKRSINGENNESKSMIISQIKQLIDDKSFIFSKGDPWIKEINSFIECIQGIR